MYRFIKPTLIKGLYVLLIHIKTNLMKNMTRINRKIETYKLRML